MTSPSAFYVARALTQWSLPALPPLPSIPAIPGALTGFAEMLIEVERIKPTMVSLDLFDTLIYRLGTTSHLQERKTASFIGWQFRHCGVIAPSQDFIQEQRKLAAEQLAAEAHDKGEHGEFELSELLIRTAALCAPETHSELTEAIGGKAATFEAGEEMACLELIPGALAFLDALRRHCRIVCVSDTALPAKTVGALVDKLGIADYFDAIYVSSREKKNKRTGSLFDAIAQQQGLAPENLLHLGDNPINDLASPLARGWHARLIRHDGLEAQYQATTQRVAMAKVFGSPDYLVSESPVVASTSKAFQVGKQSFSLAFALFALELLKLDRIHHFRKIYFISRDGHLLRESFATMAEHIRLFDGVATAEKTAYLHLSRLSTLCPDGDDGIDQAMHYATLVNWHQSGLGLFATLGFDVEKYRRLLSTEGCTDELLQSLSPDTLARIYAAVRQAPPVRDALLADIRDKRDLLAGYLKQHDFFGVGKVLLVDVGWRYRIAANLCEALGPRDDFPEMHCLLFGHTGELYSPLFKAHPGVFYDAGRDDPLEQLVFHHKELIENICTADHGTCLGYRQEGERVEATLAKTDVKSALREEMQAGIVAGVRDFADLFNRYALDECFHLAALTSLLRPFLDTTHLGYAVIQALHQPAGASHARPEDRDTADASFLYGESRSYIPDKLPPIHIDLGGTSPRRPATEPLEQLLGLVQYACRSDQPIVLWGMGLVGKLLYPHIKEKVSLVVDMDSGLHSKQYQNHVISHPNALKALAPGSFMVLFTPLSRALPSALADKDLSVVRASDWLHPNER
jgi:FMN phosphatase YigB (HAD superfamily)